MKTTYWDDPGGEIGSFFLLCLRAYQYCRPFPWPVNVDISNPKAQSLLLLKLVLSSLLHLIFLNKKVKHFRQAFGSAKHLLLMSCIDLAEP